MNNYTVIMPPNSIMTLRQLRSSVDHELVIENSLLRARNTHLHRQLKAKCSTTDNFDLIIINFIIVVIILMYGWFCNNYKC